MRARLPSIFMSCVAFAYICACSEDRPDPRSVRGAIAAATAAIEAQDSARLFRLIDQRARHAMASIVQDRRAAKALVVAHYPAAERGAALATLGDGAEVEDAAGLFARRCPVACLRALGAQLGAPTAERREGDEVVVTTARGGTLYMHAGTDGHYGLVWNTQALSEERDRASRELLQIRDNANVYEKRSKLERADAP